MFLAVDVESSDLIKRDLPLSDASQPWAVGIAAQLFGEDGKPVDFFCTKIRGDGRQIRPGAEKVHGISSRAAGRGGISEVAALGMLCGLAAQASYLIGHNVEFDRQVIEGLLIRLGKDTKLWVRPGLQSVCTMLASVALCRLPSGREDGQFKYPSLDEACEILLGESRREGHHAAWDDCDRARRVFLVLRERNCLEAAA